MLEKLNELFSPEIKFGIEEAKDGNGVDGKHVLAKVKGQFFVPDGKSRNGRFYPSSLWEKVIKDPSVKSRLKKGIMFGTIGHDAALNDAAIRKGEISHYMTEIHIDENGKGIGTALILNTPTGRILNTVLRAGSQLAVSSRANGTFKGKNSEGLPVVDEDTYDLDGWDFVIDPGFLEAQPEIAESLQKIENNIKLENSNEGDDLMDKEINKTLVEHIATENDELKIKVSKMTDELAAANEDKSELEKENTHLKEELGKLEEAEKKVAAFEELGSVEQITKALNVAIKTNEVLSQYNALADSPADAKSALEKANAFIESFNTEFGGVEKVREAVETLKKFEEFGSVEQVEEALTRYSNELDKVEEAKKNAKVKEVAEKYELTEEKAASLLEKLSEEEIAEFYNEAKNINEDDSARYKKEGKEIEEDVDTDEGKYVKKSLASQIAENLGN